MQSSGNQAKLCNSWIRSSVWSFLCYTLAPPSVYREKLRHCAVLTAVTRVTTTNCIIFYLDFMWLINSGRIYGAKTSESVVCIFIQRVNPAITAATLWGVYIADLHIYTFLPIFQPGETGSSSLMSSTASNRFASRIKYVTAHTWYIMH